MIFNILVPILIIVLDVFIIFAAVYVSGKSAGWRDEKWKILKEHGKMFSLFFGVQFLNYAVLCWNIRSVAQAKYTNIFISDLMCAIMSFKLIKKVSMSESNWALCGYALGGACGSLASTWITKRFFG